MRVLSWMLPWLVVCTATTAWGQYGLYGSPELLRLPQASSMPVENDYSLSPAQPLVQTAAVAPANSGTSARAYYAAQAPSSGPGLTPPARPAAPRPGVVDQMLQEGSSAAPGGCGCVSGPANQFAAAAACGGGLAGNCGECPWYVENNVLWMGRNGANRVYTTYQSGNNPNQLMHTDFDLDWRIGGEIRFGRSFQCGQWAAEVIYWNPGRFEGWNAMGIPRGAVSTPLMVDGIEFAGDNAADYFDRAREHRLWRESEMHNLEINFIRNVMCMPSCAPWRLHCLAGARYFRLEDELTFGSLQQRGTWGGNDGLDEAYLRDRASNNLWGFQVGAGGSYALNCKWRLFADTKLGIFDNHIENTFSAYRGDGTVANPTALSRVVGSYPVEATDDVISFLAEFKVGLHWNFCKNWGAQVGYRVVAVTDVALPDHQIPFYVVDIPELMNVKHNGDLILHGGFAGITYQF